jgi:hypothetical protein
VDVDKDWLDISLEDIEGDLEDEDVEDTELLIVWLGEGDMEEVPEAVGVEDSVLLIVGVGEGELEAGTHRDMLHSSPTSHAPQVPLHPLSPHLRLPHSGVQVSTAAPIMRMLTLMIPNVFDLPLAEI